MVSNFIDIKNDKDFKLLETNPKGNFRVVADITINMGDGSFAEDGYNWVITNPFEGVLIGELEDDSRRPRVTIINFNPSMANETAGFFKQTSGASISNLDFIWLDSVPGDENKQAITPGANLGMVSGLICDDNTSLISNVRVTAEQNDDYLINSNSTLSIAGFGGLVGYARNTNILSGVFAGKINVAISANDERGACVGGIVGYAETFKKTKSPSEDFLQEPYRD